MTFLKNILNQVWKLNKYNIYIDSIIITHLYKLLIVLIVHIL